MDTEVAIVVLAHGHADNKWKGQDLTPNLSAPAVKVTGTLPYHLPAVPGTHTKLPQ